MKTKTIFIGALGAVLALAAMPADADYIETSYVGTDDGDGVWSHEDESRYEDNGNTLSSSVAFSLVGDDDDQLQVVLSNNSPDPTTRLADVLQGVFFNAPGITAPVGSGDHDEDLGDGTTQLPEPSPVNFGLDSDFVPTGDWDEANLLGWAYRDDLGTGDDNPFNQVYNVTHGIGNPGLDDPGTGLDTFGDQDTFARWLDPSLEASDDGDPWPTHPPYGIVSDEWDEDDDWPIAGNSQPMVMNSLQFTFDVPENFEPGHIDNVVFHYGTTANIIPEPATMTLLGLGLAGLGARRYVKRQKKT